MRPTGLALRHDPPSGPQLPRNALPRHVELPFEERWVRAETWVSPPPMPFPTVSLGQTSEEDDEDDAYSEDNDFDESSTPEEPEGPKMPSGGRVSGEAVLVKDKSKVSAPLQAEVEHTAVQGAIFTGVSPQCCCPCCSMTKCTSTRSGGHRNFQMLLLELAAEHHRAVEAAAQAVTSGQTTTAAEEEMPGDAGTLDPAAPEGGRDPYFSSSATPPTSTPAGNNIARDTVGSGSSGVEGPQHSSAITPASKMSKGRNNTREGKIRGLALRHISGGVVETPLQKFVNSNTFELVSCSAIVMNVVVMAFEVQYLGCTRGYEIFHPDCDETPTRTWPWAKLAFSASACFFILFFVLEFVLRIAAAKLTASLRSAWIWLDLFLLTCGLTDLLERLSSVSVWGDSFGGINPTMLRTARILRMLRMMKVLKPGFLHIYRYNARSSPVFPSLFLLVKSIQASKQALFWSVLILIFTMTCVGMLMNQLLISFLEDDSVTEADRREVYEYFGTYTRMITTMFELTLGNWAPPSRLLMNKHSQYWGLFVVVYRCIFCFALVNVTNAVFITETNRVAASDDEVMMMRKERAERAANAKLREIFEELDESGDGCVGWEEFKVLLTDEVMRDYLGTMELEVGDLEELFHLLDDGDGQVQSQEFIDGIQTLRGQAKNIDMLTVLKLVRTINDKLDGLDTALDIPVKRKTVVHPPVNAGR